MLEVVRPHWRASPRVQALCTTRGGGVSVGAFAALNLASHVNDQPSAVAENRRRLQHALPLPSAPRWLTQVHGVNVVDADRVQEPIAADAAFTRTAGVVCAILTADCLPILLCDAAATTVIAIHAGWRGLADGIIRHTLAHIARPGAEWLAWIGPGISAENYLVGDEVRAIFVNAKRSYTEHFVAVGTRWQMDLAALARAQLAGAGVDEITQYAGCTCGESARFFSYRRDGATGRMASLIWIN